MSLIKQILKKSGIIVLSTLIAGVNFLLPVSFLIPVQIAHAAINPEINYQGKLEDSSGNAVADDTYSIVFRLYTVASGGSNIWTETNSVETIDGLFSVMLGGNTSLSGVNFNQTLYLGVNVEADGEMTPRKTLGSVPSAFEADKLDGQDGSYYLDADNLTDFGNPFYTFFSATNTDALNEGSANFYWTDTKFDNRLTATTTLPNITTLTGLTTVGTIGTGVWNGTALLDAYVANDITIDSSTVVTAPNFVADSASATSTLPQLSTTDFNITNDLFLNGSQGTSGQVLTSNGVGSTPTWEDASGGSSFGQAFEFINSTTLAPTTTNAGIGIQADFFTATSTTATSTFAGGINITGGCIAFNGTCISTGSPFNSNTFTTADTWSAFSGLSGSTTIPIWIDTTDLSGGRVTLIIDGVEESIYVSANQKVSRVVQATSSVSIKTETTGYDLSTLAFVDATSVSAQESGPQGIAFSTDGTKMFVVGYGGSAKVSEYNLSTAFDASTASYSQVKSLSAQTSISMDVAFNTDGTKMFVADYQNTKVWEYTLSTGFDVSTASVVDGTSVPQIAWVYGLAFNNDGTKLFITDRSAGDITEYTLSVAWDMSTASYVDQFSVSAKETAPSDFAFNDSGTRIYVTGDTGNDITEYGLGTAFDISTAYYIAEYSVSSQDTTPEGIVLNTDGTKLFIIGGIGIDVNEYTLGSSYSGIAQVSTGDPTGGGAGNSPWTQSGSNVYRSSGKVGIGTSSPSSLLSLTQSTNDSSGGLYISATDGDYRSIYMGTDQVLNFQGGAGNTATLIANGTWTDASDIAYKENVLDIKYGLSDLMKLSPRNYTFISDGTADIGFIAQELEAIIPEVVHGVNGSKTVSYGHLTAVTIKALQEIGQRINIFDAPTSTPSIVIGELGDISFSNDLNVSGNTYLNSLSVGSTSTTTFEGNVVFSGITSTLFSNAVTVTGTATSSFAGNLFANQDLEIGGILKFGTTTQISDSSIIASNGLSINTDQFVLTTDGSLGIGTSSPQRKLHVYRDSEGSPVRFQDSNGYCEINPTTTSWTCTSDERLKENIISLSNGDNLNKLRELRPVEFEWKTDESNGKRIGLIAQEVEKVIPDLVNTDSETGYKSVAYGGLIPYILSAIQELANKIDILTQKIEELSKNNYGATISAFRKIVVGNPSDPGGITLHDEKTGEPYCLTVLGGNIITRFGDCDSDPEETSFKNTTYTLENDILPEDIFEEVTEEETSSTTPEVTEEEEVIVDEKPAEEPVVAEPEPVVVEEKPEIVGEEVVVEETSKSVEEEVTEETQTSGE